MKHWHRCERWWENAAIACPLFEAEEHEDAKERQWPAPIAPWAEKRTKAQQKGQADFVQQAKADEDEAEKFWREVAGEPEGKKSGVPPPYRPAIRPYRPVTSQAPYRAPVPQQIAVRAMKRAQGVVPKAWRPSEVQIRQLFPYARPEFKKSPEAVGRVRRAVAEESVTRAAGDLRRSTGSFPRRRVAAGVAGAAMGGAAAVYIKGKGRRGGGGFQWNANRWVGRLTSQPARSQRRLGGAAEG